MKFKILRQAGSQLQVLPIPANFLAPKGRVCLALHPEAPQLLPIYPRSYSSSPEKRQCSWPEARLSSGSEAGRTKEGDYQPCSSQTHVCRGERWLAQQLWQSMTWPVVLSTKLSWDAPKIDWLPQGLLPTLKLVLWKVE